MVIAPKEAILSFEFFNHIRHLSLDDGTQMTRILKIYTDNFDKVCRQRLVQKITKIQMVSQIALMLELSELLNL